MFENVWRRLGWGGTTSGFEATRANRRLANWITSSLSTNSLLSAGGAKLRERAVDSARNNPYGKYRVRLRRAARAVHPAFVATFVRHEGRARRAAPDLEGGRPRASGRGGAAVVGQPAREAGPVKIGAGIVLHERHTALRLAEAAVPRALFAGIRRRVGRLRGPGAGGSTGSGRATARAEGSRAPEIDRPRENGPNQPDGRTRAGGFGRPRGRPAREIPRTRPRSRVG